MRLPARMALGLLLSAPALAGEPAAVIDGALQNVTQLVRPGRVGYATIWDGNKYVQCRRLADHTLQCEAAGSAMQPTLAAILTPERVAVLNGLGWTFDPSFGNYVRTFPADMPTATVARSILTVLVRAYDADGVGLEIQTDWIADLPCPPRNGPSQNLAGMVNDNRAMRASAIHACSFKAEAPPVPAESFDALLAQYGGLVSAELQRLRINAGRRVYAVFDAGLGYVQCQPKPPRALYCEAQSAQTWPALSVVLTPERVNRLQAAGYAPPGRAPNYWRDYDLDTMSDAALASEILAVLHHAYGYAGATKLKVSTE